MAKLTKAQREWKPNTPKKLRSTKMMFASVVLVLEAFVADLPGFGVCLASRQKPGLPSAAAVLALLLIMACGSSVNRGGSPLAGSCSCC